MGERSNAVWTAVGSIAGVASLVVGVAQVSGGSSAGSSTTTVALPTTLAASTTQAVSTTLATTASTTTVTVTTVPQGAPATTEADPAATGTSPHPSLPGILEDRCAEGGVLCERAGLP